MPTHTNRTLGQQTTRRLSVPLAILVTASLGSGIAGGAVFLNTGSAAASTATSTAVGAQEYVNAANEICRAGVASAFKLVPPHHDDDVPAYQAQLRAIAGGVQDDLRALPRPAADSELLVSHFLDPNADALARAPQVAQQAAAAQTADEVAEARREVEALRAQAEAASDFAAGYGLTDCARNAGA